MASHEIGKVAKSEISWMVEGLSDIWTFTQNEIGGH